MTSTTPWAARLAEFAHLSSEDESFLAGMTCGVRHRKVDQTFEEDRDAADCVIVMVKGVGCKTRLLADGRRQILSYLLPGDMTSPDRFLVRQPYQTICMLVPSEIAVLERADVEVLQGRPNICDAFKRYALVKEAIASEWQVNVGLRMAQERICHLLCELYDRLESIGHAGNHVFRLSLTQSQIADTVALSAVHVNRVLMELRRQGIFAMNDGNVAILDHERLCHLAGFDPTYLHVEISVESILAGRRANNGLQRATPGA
jgi:CRP-like cAMP-binding protein